MQEGRFLKSYMLAVKQMGGKKVSKKKSRGREKHEIQTGQNIAMLLEYFNVPVLRDDPVIKGSGSFYLYLKPPGFLRADFLHVARSKYSEKVGKI